MLICIVYDSKCVSWSPDYPVSFTHLSPLLWLRGRQHTTPTPTYEAIWLSAKCHFHHRQSSIDVPYAKYQAKYTRSTIIFSSVIGAGTFLFTKLSARNLASTWSHCGPRHHCASTTRAQCDLLHIRWGHTHVYLNMIFLLSDGPLLNGCGSRDTNGIAGGYYSQMVFASKRTAMVCIGRWWPPHHMCIRKCIKI